MNELPENSGDASRQESCLGDNIVLCNFGARKERPSKASGTGFRGKTKGGKKIII